MYSHEAATAAFQVSINSLHDGETLELSPREFPGPVVIRHPVTIDGRGATVWGLKGPVISVESPGVVLRDLRVEVTSEEESNSPEEGCAILVRPGMGILLERVQVRGSVIGLEEEEGDWSYPMSIHLGRLKHGSEHDFALRLYVPVACRLKSLISGIDVSTHSLKPGANELRLHVERLPQDTLLSGVVTITTAFLTRQFTVVGKIATAQGGQPEPVSGTGQVAWEPPNWSALVAGPAPPPPPPEPISEAPPEVQALGSSTLPLPTYPQDQTVPGTPRESEAAPPPVPLPAGLSSEPVTVPVQTGGQPTAPSGGATPPPQPVQVQPQVPPHVPPKLPPQTSGKVSSTSRWRRVDTSLGNAFTPPPEPKGGESGEVKSETEISAPAVPPLFNSKTPDGGTKPVEAGDAEQVPSAAPTVEQAPVKPEAADPGAVPPRVHSPRVRSVTLGSLFGQQTPGEPHPPGPGPSAEQGGPPGGTQPAQPDRPQKKVVRANSLSGLFSQDAGEAKRESRGSIFPLYLLVDCSGSSSREAREEIEKGVENLLADVRRDPETLESVWVSAIIFGDTVSQTAPLTELTSFRQPRLAADGVGRRLGEALTLLGRAIESEVRRTTDSTKGDRTPIVFLFIAGRPTDEWAAAADRMKRGEGGPTMVICTAGDDVDFAQLKKLSETVVELKNLQPDTLRAFFRSPSL